MKLVVMFAAGVLVVALGALGAGLAGLFSFGSTSDSTDPASDLVMPGGAEALAAPRTTAPRDSFSDGAWIVGQDIVAGTYAATVPTGSGGCSWQRTAPSGGGAGTILETGSAKENSRAVIVIEPSDATVQTSGCGRWSRMPD